MNPIKKRTKNYTKLPTELNNMPGLSHIAFRLYVLICGWDDFHFSYKKIGSQTGMVNRQISKAIKELISLNMLGYEPGYGFKGNKSVPNRYYLIDPKDWIIRDSPGTPVRVLNQETDTDSRYTSESGSSTPVRALPVHQRETINNKLNDTLKEESAKIMAKMDVVLTVFKDQDIVDIAKLSAGKTASEISVSLKGRLPKDFAEIFVANYLGVVGFNADSCETLENLGFMLGRKDSIVKALVKYKRTLDSI